MDLWRKRVCPSHIVRQRSLTPTGGGQFRSIVLKLCWVSEEREKDKIRGWKALYWICLHLGVEGFTGSIYGELFCVLCEFQACYPQKGWLIHSYAVVFHIPPRQILACWERHPPYLGYDRFWVCWVIHKRSRLSTVIEHFSTSYVTQMIGTRNDSPHICPRKDTNKEKKGHFFVPFSLVAAVWTATRVLSQLSHFHARCDTPLRLYNFSRIASTSRRIESSPSRDWVILSTP